MRRDLTLYNLEFPDQDKLEEYWNKRYSSDFHTEVLGRINNRSNSLKSKCGKIYEINDEILKDIFGSHKNNNERCLGWTYFKVKLLNDFYSTGIQDIYTVVEDMIKIKNLDENIKNGDFQAVNEIRDIFKKNKENKNSRDIYSFATKFCHFSNPDKFSIYDRYVAYLLKDYIIKWKDKFTSAFIKYNETSKENKIKIDKPTASALLTAMRDYTFFMNVVDLFMSNCKISKRNSRAKVDNYLWLAGMMKYREGSKVAQDYKN